MSGWGTTSEPTVGSTLSPTLRQVEIPYVPDDICVWIFGAENFFNDVFICAGAAGMDSCQGDSGGPMTFNDVHVGIVSWQYGCGRPGIPAVYSQTDAYLDWITETILQETKKN